MKSKAGEFSALAGKTLRGVVAFSISLVMLIFL